VIVGAHVLFYSTNADADRDFLRSVLKLPFVDAGHGWLIFGLPPAEAAVHPTSSPFGMQDGGRSMLGSILYLMTDDLEKDIARLAKHHVACAPIRQERWGQLTSFALPSGQAMGMYQPLHPTAIGVKPGATPRARPVRPGKPSPRIRARPARIGKR
jgi:hypothetical protein